MKTWYIILIVLFVILVIVFAVVLINKKKESKWFLKGRHDTSNGGGSTSVVVQQPKTGLANFLDFTSESLPSLLDFVKFNKEQKLEKEKLALNKVQNPIPFL